MYTKQQIKTDRNYRSSLEYTKLIHLSLTS